MRVRPLALVPVLAAALAGCADHPTTALDAVPAPQASAALPDCGFEGGTACDALETGARCDRGLQVDGRGTLRRDDDVCVNDTRHQVGTGFRASWADWALANQRTLAIDEPFNWVMHLVTHNSYNSIAEGRGSDPNQIWSISDQLDLGARGLWLDLHWVFQDIRLCHALVLDRGPEFHVGCTASDRPFAYAVREIADWLAAHPGEILFVDLEHYVENHQHELVAPLEQYFGSKAYRGDARGEFDPWPSRRELLAMGKQVIVGVDANPDFLGWAHKGYRSPNVSLNSIINFDVDSTAEGIVTACGSRAETLDLAANLPAQFRLVGEDRTSFSHGKYGYTEGGDVVNQAACNIEFISLDMLGGALYDGPRAGLTLPTEPRQGRAVWSWREGDRGSGDAAVLRGATGRWSSAAAGAQHRFACAKPRSETTRDPALWTDVDGNHWRVTTRAGAWREGGRACLDEFGSEGFVFSTPVNGWMNERLRQADEDRGDVWLNYDSIEGGWRINQRPTARAGSDRTVECAGHLGTPVRLEASQSSDPDQHALSYEWRGVFGTATGASPTVLLPLGRHEITLLVDDGFGGAAIDTVLIEVLDTTPPEIHSAAATPDTLRPPNHAMRKVSMEVNVTDMCDPNPTCRITSVTSNEPVNGRGDGNTEPDWQITDALTLELRAERAGGGSSRVYTIVLECIDASGNATSREVLVTVPHDRR